MKKLAFALACGVVAPAALAAPYPFPLVLNTNQTIEFVNLASNAGFGFNPATGFPSDSLAVTPTGQVIAAENATGALWDVTGPATPFGATGYTQIGDLDYANNGLWGYSNASDTLFFYDFGSAAVSYAQSFVVPGSVDITGVAYQTGTGDVYLAAHNGLNNDFLLRVAAATPSVLTNVGGMSHGDAASFISDIDFDASGNLVAMTWFHRWFYTVSPTSAATTFISAGPHRDRTAMALDPLPVPEPAEWAMLLAGLALVGWRVRRRG
jgi:hypothetical protein